MHRPRSLVIQMLHVKPVLLLKNWFDAGKTWHNKPILTSLTYPISYRQAHNLNWIGVIQAF